MYLTKRVLILFFVLAVLLAFAAYPFAGFFFWHSTSDVLVFWETIFRAAFCFTIGAGFDALSRGLGRIDVLSRRLDELEKKVGS